MPELVSIVMPAYNAERTIEESIRSVLAQSYPHWELLVADDCSRDGTRELVRSWSNRDARIKLLPLEKNGGPARARNACLTAAAGQWLAFLDSDDYWLPAKLERSLAFAHECGAALVFTAFRRISADGGKVGRLIEVPGRLTYERLLGNTAIATSTVLVNAAMAGDIRVEDAYYDDFVRWLLVLKRGNEAYGLNEDLMRYRLVGGSVSRNKFRSARKVWYTLRRIEGLAAPRAAWHFGRYATNALLKYSRY